MAAANPLLEAVLDYLSAGKELKAVLPERIGTLEHKVTFQFSDGTEAVRTFQCDYSTFLGWWQGTIDYLKNARSAADAFTSSPAPKPFMTVDGFSDDGTPSVTVEPENVPEAPEAKEGDKAVPEYLSPKE